MTRILTKENMSPHLITIGWNEKMERAFKRMQSQRVRHLPVANDAGEIVGMLSDRDVQRAMISQIERPTDSRVSDERIEFDEECRVRDYMSWPVRSIDQESDLRFVAERMVLEKVSSLLVCNRDKIIGIVTTEDLLRVLIQLLSEAKGSKTWNLSQILEGTFREMTTTLV